MDNWGCVGCVQLHFDYLVVSKFIVELMFFSDFTVARLQPKELR